MRIFIHYDKKGRILSVAQVERIEKGLRHPFFMTDKTQNVIELSDDDPNAKLSCSDIHDGYVVDVPKKRLTKKSEKKPYKATRKKRS